jgi:hypothetical protein
MSQKTVQLLIGKLLTDEELRIRFTRDPIGTVAAMQADGWDLTSIEADAIVQTDVNVWSRAATRIHPRLQRCSLRPGDHDGRIQATPNRDRETQDS